MQCHLGPSQGKYCDRAFTFVLFTVSALPHNWSITPQNTHTHMQTYTRGKTNTMFSASFILSVTLRFNCMEDMMVDNLYHLKLRLCSQFILS